MNKSLKNHPIYFWTLFFMISGCSNNSSPAKLDSMKKDGIWFSDGISNRRDTAVGSSDSQTTTSKDGAFQFDGSQKKDYSVWKDKGSIVDASAKCPSPKKATTNSVTQCTQDDQTCPTGEACILYPGDSIGICVGLCCPDNTKPWNDEANRCPVKDSQKQYSFCATLAPDVFACDLPCYIKTKAGKEYNYTCPDPNTFECIEVEPDQTLLPDFSIYKICAPKQPQ